MTSLIKYLLGDEKAAQVFTRTLYEQHWYMASDICMFMGISAYSHAVQRHLVPGEWIKQTHYTGGGNRHVLLINNLGVQKLLSVFRTERAAKIRERARNIPAYLKVEPWLF